MNSFTEADNKLSGVTEGGLLFTVEWNQEK